MKTNRKWWLIGSCWAGLTIAGVIGCSSETPMPTTPAETETPSADLGGESASTVAPAESTEPKPAETPAETTEAPAPSANPTPAESTPQAETVTPAPDEKPAETPPSTEAPAPSETPAPESTPAPSEGAESKPAETENKSAASEGSGDAPAAGGEGGASPDDGTGAMALDKTYVDDGQPIDPTAVATEEIAKMKVQAGDWPQWGGSPERNNTPPGSDIVQEWSVGQFDEDAQKYEGQENVKWVARLGSQSYGNPVVANGKVFVGTNNGAGYIDRYPNTVDLGCLLCFDEKTGEFLWQHSSPKLPTGRVHDWPLQGICSTVYAEGDRVWYVTSRGEVCCLDAEGFKDGENDGPYKAEDNEFSTEADVVWKYDMMGEMGISQHNMCSCSLTCIGDVLFVCTSNGVDVEHLYLPAPNAPSFFAMDRNTQKILWTDKSPGLNILHGQWSSPAYGVFEGQAQVIFCGGDAWCYSFDPAGDGNGNAKLLWKFDCNPKETEYIVGGRGTRNELIATPVVYDGLVYVAVGQDPEHGMGDGHLWCINPNKRGDVSPELAVDAEGKELAPRRLLAIDVSKGEKAIPNPNSAAVWHYGKKDWNENGEIEFEEEMHRSIGTVAIKDDILYIADFSGLFHCVDAKTGKPFWVHDMYASAWGSPLIVDGKVYIGDEDGDVSVFEHSKEKNLLAEVSMTNSVYSTPVVANNTLFIANKSHLFAITPGGN